MIKKRIISLVVIICMCVGVLPATSVATTQDSLDSVGISIYDVIAGLARPDEFVETINPDEVPEIIDYQTALLRNHVERLYNEEDTLNQLIFRNADGSKTMYLYNHPVKYIDENGCVQDISLEISDSLLPHIGFETTANSTEVMFPVELSSGIQIEDGFSMIRISHNIANGSSDTFSLNISERLPEVRRINKNVIEYNYDENTKIQYSLTYTGIKERIIVEEFTGQSEYSITLNTNGQFLEQIGGSYFLVDDAGTIRVSIGDVLVRTADGRNNSVASIIPTAVVEGQEYELRIILDNSYLNSDDTIYPISIEPAVEMVSTVGNAIEDVTIYSNGVSNGASDILHVGMSGENGISRVLMKFPGLDLNQIGSDAEITVATVEIYDLLQGTDELDVYCHVMQGGDWEESTADGSDTTLRSVGRFLSKRTISYSNGILLTTPHRYSFDITKAVQGWIDGEYSLNKGVLFKSHAVVESGDVEKYKTFGSYNRTDCRPAISITYTDDSDNQLLESDVYYINNIYSGNYLKYTNTTVVGRSGLLQELGNDIWWEIRKANGGYVIRLANNPQIYLGVAAGTISENVELIQIDGSNIPQNCVWSITLSSKGGCLIKNTYNARYLYTLGGDIYTSSGTGAAGSATYDSRVWRIISTAKYGYSSAYDNMELSDSAYIEDLYVYVGAKMMPTVKASAKEIWRAASDFEFSTTANSKVIIDDQTKLFTGCSYGSFYATAVHKVTGREFVFPVYVRRFTIYETLKTMYADIDGSYPEDLTYGDMTKDQLRALQNVNWTNFLFDANDLRGQWEQEARLFSTQPLQQVALDMISHFMEGTGTQYSNSTLSASVVAHERTQLYVAGIEDCIRDLLVEYDGDIWALYYYDYSDPADRRNHPLIALMKARNIEEPSYQTASDMLNGLVFCIHGLWGNRIEVSQFSVTGNTYTCTIRYTLYDHFGLDQEDVEKFYGLMLGTTQWYVLQHYEGFNGAYKPFVTVIEFEETFSGTF